VDVFEEWVRHDVGQVFVQLFDVTLEAFFGRHLLCLHAPTCGYGPALEHNGDLYSCDHFVELRFKLGNIHQTHMLELVASPGQRKFGDNKRDTLTTSVRDARSGTCATADVRRIASHSRATASLARTTLPGLELFFMHTGPAFSRMAQMIQQGHAPSEVMAWVATEDAKHGPINPALRKRQKISLLPRQKSVITPDKNDMLSFRFNNLEDNQYETKIAQINYDVGYRIARISELSRYRR